MSVTGKRKRRSNGANTSAKRQRTEESRQPPIVPLLEQYYNEVHSLRVHLASKLPKSAKKRRRRLLRYGLQPMQDDSVLVEDSVTHLLDTILVGNATGVCIQDLEQLDQDMSVFTQQVTETDISISPSAGRWRQSEVGS